MATGNKAWELSFKSKYLYIIKHLSILVFGIQFKCIKAVK